LDDLLDWGFEEKDFEFNFAPEAKEYDELIADEVEMIECPNCGHRFPK